jgi:hypothetical protein
MPSVNERGRTLTQGRISVNPKRLKLRFLDSCERHARPLPRVERSQVNRGRFLGPDGAGVVEEVVRVKQDLVLLANDKLWQREPAVTVGHDLGCGHRRDFHFIVEINSPAPLQFYVPGWFTVLVEEPADGRCRRAERDRDLGV